MSEHHGSFGKVLSAYKEKLAQQAPSRVTVDGSKVGPGSPQWKTAPDWHKKKKLKEIAASKTSWGRAKSAVWGAIGSALRSKTGRSITKELAYLPPAGIGTGLGPLARSATRGASQVARGAGRMGGARLAARRGVGAAARGAASKPAQAAASVRKAPTQLGKVVNQVRARRTLPKPTSGPVFRGLGSKPNVATRAADARKVRTGNRAARSMGRDMGNNSYGTDLAQPMQRAKAFSASARNAGAGTRRAYPSTSGGMTHIGKNPSTKLQRMFDARSAATAAKARRPNIRMSPATRTATINKRREQLAAAGRKLPAR